MNKNILFIIKEVDFIDNFGIAILSGVAKQKGWDTFFSVFNKKRTVSLFKEINPEIVCYSVMSCESEFYLKVNSFLKEKFRFTSMMGGAHPTYFPQVINDKGLDFICRGEGEEAFAEFLEKYERGESLEKIQNISTKKTSNPVRDLIRNLDDIPIPDRSLIFDNTYLGRLPLKTFMTSRGCPFSCSYCYNTALREIYRGKGKFLRFHSTTRVVEEIEQVKKSYPLEFIKFEDDLFASNRKWLEEFAPYYKEKCGIPFNCLIRIEHIDDELIRLLKMANCHSVTVAIDSANERIRNEILNRNMRISNKEIEKKLLSIKEAGIYLMSNIIVGVPTSQLRDELEGLELSLRAKIDFGSATILTPYLGTPIWDYIVKNGLVSANANEYCSSSLLEESVLKSFSEKEKETQVNLVALLPLIVRFHFLKKLILFIARNFRPNRIFVLLYVVTKAYVLGRYIYPCNITLRDKIKFFIRAIQIEGQRIFGFSNTR